MNTLSPEHDGVAVSVMTGIISVPQLSNIIGATGALILKEQSTMDPSSGGRAMLGAQQV